MPFDLRAEYVKARQHRRHLDRLRRKVIASPPNTDLKLLLGAMYHFSGQPEEAELHVVKAARRVKDDPLLTSLHRAVRLSMSRLADAPAAGGEVESDRDVKDR